KEPKYGLAVTGLIEPKKVKTKGGANPGDLLFLTKPLGVGVVTTALKRQMTEAAHVAAAVASMSRLNKSAAEAAQLAGATAVTDITGFGLLGHAHEMAHLGDVDFRFDLGSLPWLPGALAYGAAGAFPGGMGNNMRFFGEWVRFGEGVSQLYREMLFTPETSGGLLVAVPPERAEKFSEQCETAVHIGQVLAGDGHIQVKVKD
ncbi:MAG: selenide, water dikinase SelD, partial [Anaerolineae bacterium]